MLKPTLLAGSARRSRWKFIESLPVSHREGETLMVHGSPRDPVHEYIMKTDVIFVPDKIRDVFRHFEGLCFVGHTHFPGVFTEDLRFRDPSQLDYHFEWGGEKAIVNVGSVGQPRDGDPRAAWLELETADGLAHYHRVPYDVEEAAGPIIEAGLPKHLAERLYVGH
jgi:diadenosine tetraphosphatase ApaH/serine/threonine PP2A family protein phosphatase